MLLFFISLCWFLFALYFVYSLGKQYYGREFLTSRFKSPLSEFPFLSVIVPARNEEENIERCVTSLLDQSYFDEKYEIIVVDDNSTDATASIVRRLQAKHDKLQLAKAGELPKGWKGKNHACWKGVSLAKGEWYCFIDADIKAEHALLESAVNFALSGQIDMLSINPFQELISFSERLLLPGVFFAIASSMNFKRVNDPSRTEAVANGQFILFECNAYRSIKGHHAVRDEIMEDLALARLVKRSGLRLYWIFSDELIRTRMYQDLSQIWEGFSKNLMEIMGTKGILNVALTSVKSLLLGWMPPAWPLVAALSLTAGSRSLIEYLGLGLSLLTLSALFSFGILAVKALKIPLWYVISLPLGFTLHSILSISSVWKRQKGGRKWKGRTYQ